MKLSLELLSNQGDVAGAERALFDHGALSYLVIGAMGRIAALTLYSNKENGIKEAVIVYPAERNGRWKRNEKDSPVIALWSVIEPPYKIERGAGKDIAAQAAELALHFGGELYRVLNGDTDYIDLESKVRIDGSRLEIDVDPTDDLKGYIEPGD